MRQVNIVMYHYVRDLSRSRYPKIKGLPTHLFKEQITYLKKHYTFVTMEQCIEALDFPEVQFPDNAVLLTFDDGYIDHYTTVFPILDELHIQGSFFPPAKTILDDEVLDVNKIHFLLASVEDIGALIKDIMKYLQAYRAEYQLADPEYYYKKLATPSRFDTAKTMFIKRLLQRELNEELRSIITRALFKKYVTNDPVSFARELYMDLNQLRTMSRNQMFIGGHGYHHYWLNYLKQDQQEQEIDHTISFLEKINESSDSWVMCYPYGAYDDSLISILKRKKCKLALTTNPGVAKLNEANRYTLDRLDTNDLPKSSTAKYDPFVTV